MLVLPLESSDLAAESRTNDWASRLLELGWESETQFRNSGTVSLCCLSVDDGGGRMCGDNRSVALMVAEVPKSYNNQRFRVGLNEESTEQTDKYQRSRLEKWRIQDMFPTTPNECDATIRVNDFVPSIIRSAGQLPCVWGILSRLPTETMHSACDSEPSVWCGVVSGEDPLPCCLTLP
jgi:hypothetical protein